MSDADEKKILHLLEKESTPEWKKPAYWVSMIGIVTSAGVVATFFVSTIIEKTIVEQMGKTSPYSIDKRVNGNRGVVENSRSIDSINYKLDTIIEELKELKKKP